MRNWAWFDAAWFDAAWFDAAWFDAARAAHPAAT